MEMGCLLSAIFRDRKVCEHILRVPALKKKQQKNLSQVMLEVLKTLLSKVLHFIL